MPFLQLSLKNISLILRLVWFLLTCCCLTLRADRADGLWNQSVKELHDGPTAQTCQNLKTWVAEQATHHISSPEAMFNLGLCSWKIKRPSESVLYFFEGLKLRSSLFKRWSDITVLQNTQRELGIRENIPTKTLFILQMLLPKEVAWIFGIIGSWMIVFLITFKKLIARQTWVFYFGTSICWILSLIVLISHNFSGQFGVVSGDEEKSVFIFDKSGGAEELTKLPPGTMVEIVGSRQDYSQITKPIAGWVKSDSIQTAIITN